MIYLVALGCLALGIIVGVLIASYMSSGPTRVKELESQIRNLKERHGEYKDSVSDHFGMTAELIQHMTESYREVYQHLAAGAQDLCSAEVANKLLPADSDAVFDGSARQGQIGEPLPPRDYATKDNPYQKGALSEDFGLEKSKPVDFKPKATPVAPTTSTEAKATEPAFAAEDGNKDRQQETLSEVKREAANEDSQANDETESETETESKTETESETERKTEKAAS